MPVTAIVGAQWGDEGKGKITDLLAHGADVVLRYGGGSNAGHTVVNEFGEFKLHLIPCGIFNPQAISLVGTGAVVDFDFLLEELRQLQDAGVSWEGLRISSRAHVIMPYHIMLDRLQDEARGTNAIGTTRRGVGPAYVDKADRIGIQVGDLLDLEVVRGKLNQLVPRKNGLLMLHGVPPIDVTTLMEAAERWRDIFADRIVDHVQLVAGAIGQGQTILLEGQLGALRDLDWGTYPYVTSSTTIAGGGAVGGGVPPMCINDVVGVVKAYTTSVGAGPLPAELFGAEADDLRERGNEYGATTGRPRRVGWFDAVATRYACLLNGFTRLAVTKLDVLDGFDSLKICVAYDVDGVRYDSVPATTLLERALPIYEDVPGWRESTSHSTGWKDLPPAAQSYLDRIEQLVGAPIDIVSVGQAREETIIGARSPAHA